MNDAGPFLITSEYRRFAEFCDACRQLPLYRAVLWSAGRRQNLVGSPLRGVGPFRSVALGLAAPKIMQLAGFADADTVLYTPEIVNSPRAVADGVRRLCTSLRSIREEPQRRAEQAAAKAQRERGSASAARALLEGDWFAPPSDADEEPLYHGRTYHAGPPAAGTPVH